MKHSAQQCFCLFAPDVESSPANHLWLLNTSCRKPFFFCQHHFYKRLTCDLLLFSHKHQPVFFAPSASVSYCNNKVIPLTLKRLRSVPCFFSLFSVLTVGDSKLPVLPPPQIPSCLSKYPPHSQSVWHSNTKCDRGCTCVRPYVCVWLASQGFGRKQTIGTHTFT